jgi:hypothetical protein
MSISPISQMNTIKFPIRLTIGLLFALAISPMASAFTIFDTTSSVSTSDPTQQGRLSRNNAVGQDWGLDEAFPGIVNTGVTYHYHTYTIPSASIQPGRFVQIILDDLGPSQGNIFVSAYQNFYAPNSGVAPLFGFDANWLGDNGFSGNFFGGSDTVSFQVQVPAGADLVLVVTNTGGGNVGTGEPFRLIAQAYTDPAFTSPPIFNNVSSNITAEATGPNGAAVSFTSPTALDADNQNASVVCAPASGSTFPLGTTPVTCTATGADGSVSTTMFNVTVHDTTGPVITTPSNISVQAAKKATSAVVTFAVSAHDLVDGNVPAIATPPSGSSFPVGTTTVHVTAQDSHGNMSSKNFTVTVTQKKKKKK